MLTLELRVRNATPTPLMETWISPKIVNQRGCMDHCRSLCEVSRQEVQELSV